MIEMKNIFSLFTVMVNNKSSSRKKDNLKKTEENPHSQIRYALCKHIRTCAKFATGKLYLILQSLLLPAHILSGKEKNSFNMLTIVVLGTNQHFISYLSDLLFSEPPQITRSRTIRLWSTGEQNLQQRYPDADFIIIKVDRFFTKFLQSHGFIVIPEWISMTIKPEEFFSSDNTNLRRNVKREIRKSCCQDYTYEISTDPEKLCFFYHHMYLPYIQWRFGHLALQTPYRKMKEHFKDGRLLLVKKDNKYVRGVLIKTLSRTTAILTHIGMIDNGTESYSKGIGAILYYYSLLWAQRNNITYLDLGYCRSFLNDGVLQYKRKWGASVQQWKTRIFVYNYSGIIGLKLCNYTSALRQCLCHNPFIYIDNDEKLNALACISQNRQGYSKQLQHYKKIYNIPGLSHISFTTPNKIMKHEESVLCFTSDQTGDVPP